MICFANFAPPSPAPKRMPEPYRETWYWLGTGAILIIIGGGLLKCSMDAFGDSFLMGVFILIFGIWFVWFGISFIYHGLLPDASLSNQAEVFVPRPSSERVYITASGCEIEFCEIRGV